MRLTLLLSLLSTVALAQGLDRSSFDFDQLTDARGFAYGGAYRILGIGADATDGNPASLLAQKTYQIELTGGWDANRHNGMGAVAIRDSQTSDVGAGVSYHYLSLKDALGNSHSAHVGTLALALPFSDAVYLGFAGRFVHEADLPHINAATMDVGLEVQPAKGLFVGLSGHNLINTHHPELARYYVTGLGYTQGIFAAELDVSGDPWREGGFKPRYQVGAEAVVASAMPVRLGFDSDTLTGAKYVSGGLGFLSEGGSIDVAYRHRTDSNGEVVVVTIKMQM